MQISGLPLAHPVPPTFMPWAPRSVWRYSAQGSIAKVASSRDEGKAISLRTGEMTCVSSGGANLASGFCSEIPKVSQGD